MENNTQFRKAWRASIKRYDAATQDVQARLRFERAWLFSMVLDFIGGLQEKSPGSWISISADEQITDLSRAFGVL